MDDKLDVGLCETCKYFKPKQNSQKYSKCWVLQGYGMKITSKVIRCRRYERVIKNDFR